MANTESTAPKKTRKPNWSDDQSPKLATLVEENKKILLGKFGPGITAQKKKETWANVTSTINTTFSGCTRTPEEVEKKWHNIQTKAKVDISSFRKSTIGTGGGPSTTPNLSTLSEVVLDILGPDSMAITGVPNATDTTMLQITDIAATNEDRSDEMSALGLRTLQALGGFAAIQVPEQPQRPTSAKADTSFYHRKTTSRPCQSSGPLINLFNDEQNDLITKKLKLEIECLELKKAILIEKLGKTGCRDEE